MHTLSHIEGLALDHSVSTSLAFAVNGQHFEAKVINLSKEHVDIQLDENLHAALSEQLGAGQELLTQVALTMGEEVQGHLKLHIDTISSETAELHPEDDSSRARLWEALYTHTDGFVPLKKRRDEVLDPLPGRGLYTEQARQERLAFLREKTASKLVEVQDSRFEAKALTSNIENFIGSLEIPVGCAGPLKINGKHAKGTFYAPFATTEGALVASVARGATAISRAGGVNVRVLGSRMMRAPMFSFRDMKSAYFFEAWAKDHFDEIKAETQKYSHYADLTGFEAEVLGKNVHLHFVYETGDAAGQNMTTTCTWHACMWVMKQIKAFPQLQLEDFIVDGNQSCDKKVSYQSFIQGRGVQVQAEVIIPKEIMRTVLKAEPEAVYHGMVKSMSGAFSTGLVGFNVNVANVIGAMYPALGQDIACVHESSVANMQLDLTPEGDFYIAMLMPTLVVGSVGGGTGLAQQQECLEMIDCAGPGNKYKLAEIICAYCLALDLSTMSAMSSGHFARAHERLGRNRPIDHLKLSELNPDFFTGLMRDQLQDDSLEVLSAAQIENAEVGCSIITEFAARKVNKLIGLLPFRLRYKSSSHAEKELEVMVKIKATDKEVAFTSTAVAGMCNEQLADEFYIHQLHTGPKGCDQRELAIFSEKDARFQSITPKIYGRYVDPEREAYVLVAELLSGTELMDSAGDVSGWTEEHLNTAIRGIATYHSLWWGKESELREQEWIGHYPTTERMVEMSRLFDLLGAHSYDEFSDWLTHDDINIYRDRIRDLPEWWSKLEAMPKTLIHGDFNPRNITFRRNGEKLELCAYDWELATVHVAQRDIAELLLFTLDENCTLEQLKGYVELHRHVLQEALGENLDSEACWQAFRYSVWDLMLSRVSIYLMVHTLQHYEFMERLWATLRRILTLIEE